jgi:SAM-dependent methyltransferase
MTDEIARYNVERWRRLAAADAVYTRPRLNLTPETARRWLDPAGRVGDVTNLRVLCLASGGGQQSVGYALLGAQVTVFDLSAEQLARDRAAAQHYGVAVETVEGDMRDLSALPAAAFDLVFHPYSLNFVPDARAVFAEVARVVRAGGRYNVSCANPFYFGLNPRDWDGAGYALKHPYLDGAALTNEDEAWVYEREGRAPIAAPREFRHSLSTLVAGLTAHGFVIQHVSDQDSIHPDPHAAPGTWDHFVGIAPPWLAFWTVRRPDA